MYLRRDQIAQIIERLGARAGTRIIHGFFESYRRFLSSADVTPLYDDGYFVRIGAHPVVQVVGPDYLINRYTQYAFDYICPRLSPHDTVLDFGCGAGDVALAIAYRTGASVVGIDINTEQVSAARRRALQSNLRCTFLAGAMDRLDEVRRPLAAVILNDVTEHLNDGELRLLFERLRLLLAETGEVVLHTPNGLALCNDTDWSLLQMLYKAYQWAFHGWRGFVRDLDQLYYDQVHINIKSYAQLRGMLSKLGWTSRVIYDSTHRWRVLDAVSPNMLVIARPV